jgi:ribonucleoside-diphosphate reductase alpha chain
MNQVMNKSNEKTVTLPKTDFLNEFSKDIYEQTYKFGDEDINTTHLRVAQDLASVETDKIYWTQQFLKMLENFNFVPGGRITSNAGTELKGTTYINCFVDGFVGEDQDSMEGILDTLRRQALILKSEGGYGFCADVMRPRGTFIRGIGNESPGSVRMLDMWDTQSSVITEGSGKKSKKKNSKGKIRKGAQMVTVSIWHPDIEEFITAKQTSGRLTKFNMSVLVTDDFMTAVEKNQPWNLEFPVVGEDYRKEWDGNLGEWKRKGYPTEVYKTFENANELWNMITTSTYTRNEPGILFVDTMNRMNNLKYCEYISATNPCGEQILPIGGVCLLGSLNLTQFVDFENKDWDYSKLKEIIPIAIRFMDNVNDKTYVPLESQRQGLLDKRRLGLGIMGYGSALMMLKIKYGSKKALEMTDKLMAFIANTSYKASSLLAKEKGSFRLYDRDEYLKSAFVQGLDKDTIDSIYKNGMRNSHLLSIQPTGNSSVFANNVSGGLEPIFLPEYIRTTIVPFEVPGLSVPKNINWPNKTFDSTSEWTWVKEGDESLLRIDHNGDIYKFDKSRGLLKETVVRDYAVAYLNDKNQWNPEARWVSTTSNLSIKEHVDTMKVLSKYIDSAMSKTINISNDYPYEDFKKVYTDCYKSGTIKGCTTYRAGTMTTVLSEIKTDGEKDGEKIVKNRAPKRPKTLPCDIHHLTVQGHRWIVLVGLMEGDPYEVFAFKKKNISLPDKWKTGELTKIKKGCYNLLSNGLEIENLAENFQKDEEEALTRLISTSLRHGAEISFIFDQLLKSEGSVVSFSKAVARTLKKYINMDKVNTTCDDCGDPKGLVMSEGCFKCISCGYSKCD